jgi:hypothetical protein
MSTAARCPNCNAAEYKAVTQAAAAQGELIPLGNLCLSCRMLLLGDIDKLGQHLKRISGEFAELQASADEPQAPTQSPE